MLALVSRPQHCRKWKWEIFCLWNGAEGKVNLWQISSGIFLNGMLDVVVEHLLLRFSLGKSIAVIINIIIRKWSGPRRRHASFSQARCQRLLLHLELIYSLHAVNRKQFSARQSNGTEEQKLNILHNISECGRIAFVDVILHGCLQLAANYE